MFKKLFGRKGSSKKFKTTLLNYNSAIEKHGEAKTFAEFPPMFASTIMVYVKRGKSVYGIVNELIFNYRCSVCEQEQPHTVYAVHRYWATLSPERQAIISCKNCGAIVIDEPLEKLGTEIVDADSGRSL